MSIFSVLSRNTQDQRQQQQQQEAQYDGAASPDAASSTRLMSDSQVESAAKGLYQTAPTSQSPSYPSREANQVESSGVSDFLSQVDFSSSELNPLASPGGIEYLSMEDGPTYTGGIMPSRGWSDDLCYGTGTMYILGLSTGGVWGFLEGMRSQHGRNFKLRLNSVLNSMTRRGPFVANSLGVLAMFYNTINYSIGSYRGKKDQYNNVGAAAISGMLFKIGAGPRTSMISGLICAGVVGTYQACLAAYNDYKEKKVIGSVALSSPSEPQLS
ncbi:Mitochondrial import inner membrane translocase subunit tim23 [Coemansia sp. RSA 1939]|nr:Mitochondrial import inner membrane translocase subunit tim23 [Coemansia sp. RSA 1939]KAJ2610861.1 Mitochondrial import inner membrane translocase subunit tim23 [Coemansia sp. RSA 1804]KAJ2674388.1 Mitochondrial import inner membrane translocase subunit tim23 [Coemansia sp. RSA 1285]